MTTLKSIFEGESIPERYVVVDFQNTLWKSWMVKPMGGQDLTRADGYPTGHVYRFFRTIYKWKRDFMGHLVFCYEGGEQYRYDIFPEYKAGRKREKDFDPAPDVMKMLSFIKCTELKPVAAEADDAIAAFVSRRPEAEHLILSSDKDLWTCRGPNVQIVSFQDMLTDENIHKSCTKHYGVATPKSITLAKSLFGDQSDGLPGVPRLLKKHMASVLQKAADPDELFTMLDELPAKTASKVREYEEQIRKMHTVVQLRLDVKIRKRERPGDEEQLRKFLLEFECPSLLHQAQAMCY